MDNEVKLDGTPAAPSPSQTTTAKPRADSAVSERSQTAQDFISQQLQLEADAREALPYQFDTCTKPLGSLRQAIFACLTCTPPPASIHQQFTAAGVCYSCSISCHGEHELVELFTKRDFVCDCGTTRMENGGTPCSLRTDAVTGTKGGIIGEIAREGNEYNHNFKGTFCACGETYDPEKEKGTMFQCLGLGKLGQGGCGEDWWHPECLLGLPRAQHVKREKVVDVGGQLPAVKEETEDEMNGNASILRQENQTEAEEVPLPDGFPAEDDFEHLICYKCVAAFPWIKSYAGSNGFLPAVPLVTSQSNQSTIPSISAPTDSLLNSNKRRREEDGDGEGDAMDNDRKRARSHDLIEATNNDPLVEPKPDQPKHAKLGAPSPSELTLFVKGDFRDHLCRCPECFPRLSQHPQLLEEEDTYEPPVSESDEQDDDQRSIAGRSVNSGSLLDRGEAALSSMDRVRAIEGVMAYNRVRDKVKAFLQPFAESGQPVGIEDVKSYFAKLRGDDQAMREAAMGAEQSTATDHRREQGGH